MASHASVLVSITTVVSTTYIFRIFFFSSVDLVYMLSISLLSESVINTNHMHYLNMDNPKCRRNWATKFLVEKSSLLSMRTSVVEEIYGPSGVGLFRNIVIKMVSSNGNRT